MAAALPIALAAPAALAQSASCAAFKDRVAASIEAKGIQGYALEIVRSRTPVPPGARVVGRCDGGAYAVIYRRWAGAAAAPADEPASEAATAPPPAVPKAVPAAASRATPSAVSRAAAASSPTAVASAAPAATPSGSSKKAPDPVSKAPPPAVAAPAPAAVPTTLPAAVPPAAASTPRHDVAPVPATAQADAPPRPVAATSSSVDDLARPVVWLITVLLALAFTVRGVRRWLHRRYYDDAGLPRGPRLTR